MFSTDTRYPKNEPLLIFVWRIKNYVNRALLKLCFQLIRLIRAIRKKMNLYLNLIG